jgi:hypothetical protein
MATVIHARWRIKLEMEIAKTHRATLQYAAENIATIILREFLRVHGAENSSERTARVAT